MGRRARSQAPVSAPSGCICCVREPDEETNMTATQPARPVPQMRSDSLFYRVAGIPLAGHVAPCSLAA